MDEMDCHEKQKKKQALDISPMFQLGTDMTARDQRWFCQRQYTRSFLDGDVEIFFIDTSPMILGYHDTDWAQFNGGIQEQSWEAQVREIEGSLKASNAAWKIVVGHHPPRSNGEHGNNTDLIDSLEPIMKKYGAKVYFSGHDHNLEHMRWDDVGMDYIVSGAGSDCDRDFETSVGSLYQYQYSGFVAVEIHGDGMKVNFYTLEHKEKPSYSTLLPL